MDIGSNMKLQIKGDVSSNELEVDSNNNIKINTTTDQTISPFVTLSSNVTADESVTDTHRALEVTENFRTRTADSTLMFYDNFSQNNTVDFNNWTYNLNAPEIRSGFLTINPALNVGNVTAQTFTRRMFPVYSGYYTKLEMNVLVNAPPQAGQHWVWGFGNYSSGVPTPLNTGYYFQMTANGEFKCTVADVRQSNDGSEKSSPPIDFSQYVKTNHVHKYTIYCGIFDAKFYIDDVLVWKWRIDGGNALYSGNSHFRITAGGRSVSTDAPRSGIIPMMKVSAVSLSLDSLRGKKYSHIYGGMQRAAMFLSTGAGGQTSNYTNSLATGAGAALSNTSAGTFTTLGGQFTVLPTLTAGTDGILCSYQIPAGSNTTPGRALHITGIRIQGAVTTVLAGGPVIYEYALGVGSSAVSLATTDSATTKAPRRMPLGTSTYILNAPVASIGAPVSVQFKSPIVAEAGSFVTVIAKNVGTVTTTGAIVHLVTFDGYWE